MMSDRSQILCSVFQKASRENAALHYLGRREGAAAGGVAVPRCTARNAPRAAPLGSVRERARLPR